MEVPKNRYYDYETMPMGSGELSPVRNNHLQKSIEFLSEVKDGKVLEVGCGGGQFVRLLSYVRKEFDYFGTDISKKAISIASNKDNRIKYCVADLVCMPFKQKSFDVIIAFDVFEHIHDFKKAISNIYFSLRDKGIMVAYVPCEGEPFTLYWLFSKINIWKSLQRKHFGHIQSFKKDEIEELLKENGFRIIKKNMPTI